MPTRKAAVKQERKVRKTTALEAKMPTVPTTDTTPRRIPVRMNQRRAARAKFAAYRGADAGRLLGDWTPTNASADATLSPDKQRLVDRSYDSMRSSPLLAGGVKKVVDNVIGDGLRAMAELDADTLGISQQQAQDYEGMIDDVWTSWIAESDYTGNAARSANFYEQQECLLRTDMLAGENFILPRYAKIPGRRSTFSIQILEPAQVCNPDTPPSGVDLRDGIEIGSRGEVVAVHVLNQHPGFNATMGANLGAYKPKKWQRIPAVNSRGAANVWHVFKQYRLGATRGEPVLAPLLAGARQLGNYIGDVMTRAEMAAMFGILVLQQQGFAPEDAVSDADKRGSEDEQDRPQVEMFPGAVNYLGVGEDAKIINPELPGAEFETVTDRLIAILAGHLGLGQEEMANSFTKGSFSQSRLGVEVSRRGFRMIQKRMYAKYIEPIRARVIMEAWLRGDLPFPNFWENLPAYLKYIQIAPAWPFPEPLKDAMAQAKRLENKVTTLAYECGQTGKDYREVIKGQGKEKALVESYGLTYPGEPDATKDTAALETIASDDAQDSNGGKTNATD